MLKYYLVTICSLLFILNKGITQEFRVIENPINYYTYDKFEKTIYYEDLFTGEIYKTGIDSTFREYFLPDGYTTPFIFNNSHTSAIIKFTYNGNPKYELYFYEFDNDTLLFKSEVTGGILISPSDKNILLRGDEPSYYSIIDDTVVISELDLFIDHSEWKDDYSFFFISSDQYLYKYNYPTSTIDTLIEFEEPNKEITSVAYNHTENILAYGYHCDGNNQLILMDVITGNKKVIYDMNDDHEHIQGLAILIKNIKWSFDFNKIAFFLRYYTLSASDIMTYNCEEEKWKRHTDWGNYGVKYNLQWINQDTILYEYDSQIYGFNLKEEVSIKQAPIPKTYEISVRNYPNPFNASTNIKVKLPPNLLHANIRVDIYNTNGQRVQQLYNYIRENNSLIFTWDSQSNNNLNISSGLYFLKIIIMENGKDKAKKSHKVILIK